MNAHLRDVQTNKIMPEVTNDLFHTYNGQQGVRYGGVFFPPCHKVFINHPIKTYNTHQHRCRIGPIKCGCPIVADDITIASFDREELKTILDTQDRFATTER